MNILFISPSNTIGGAERSLYEMLKYLHGQGHNLFVALPPSNEREFEHLLRPYVSGLLFIPLMPVNCLSGLSFFQSLKGWTKRLLDSRGAWLYSVPRLIRFIRRHRIDRVHTNTLLVLDGAFAARWAGVPHVQHVREITGYGAGALYALPLQKRPQWFKRWAGKLHHLIIANSKYVAAAHAAFFPSDKIRVCYNIVETGEIAARDGFHPLTLGMVANVSSRVKNHLLFIRVAALLAPRFPDLRFYIYGKMPPAADPYRQSLEQAVVRYGLQKKLYFKGVCNDPVAMYGNLGALLHPYPYETFGRIYVEAMGHGLPVVAAAGGGATELISNDETGLLFTPDDAEQAALLLENLLTTPELYARLSRNGIRHAQTFRLVRFFDCFD